jgi:hypothetical protein
VSPGYSGGTEPPVDAFQALVGQEVATGQFLPDRIGDVCEQPLCVTTRAEHVIWSVPDADRRFDPGGVDAPRSGERDAVVDPAVHALCVGRHRPIEMTGLQYAISQSFQVGVGKFVSEGDFGLARLRGGYGLPRQPLDQRPVGLLSLLSPGELLYIARRHPSEPVQVRGVEGRGTDDTRTPLNPVR